MHIVPKKHHANYKLNTTQNKRVTMLMSPFPTDEVSPELSPSQGNTAPPVLMTSFVSLFEQRTCEVNRMGENSSFIVTRCIETVPVYDFKLVWVVLHASIFQRIFQNDLLTRGK